MAQQRLAVLLAAVLWLSAGAALAAPPGSPPPAASSKGTRSGPELLAAVLANPSPVKGDGFFTLAPAEIASLTEAVIELTDKNLNRSAASVHAPNWAATMQPHVENAAMSDLVTNLISFPSSVSPDKATRDASLKASDRLSNWAVDAGLREDVYAALKAFNATEEARQLKGERARLLFFSMRDARRAGLELPKAKRDQLAALLKRMSKLGLDFSSCLDEDTTHLSFTPAELNGTTKDFIASHKRDPKDPSKVVLTVKYPDYFPVMEECTVESTRKRMELAYNSVCGDANTKRLDELTARLLGYPSWAAYVQEVLMAKGPKRVASFLGDLRDKLKPLRDEQLAVLLDLKRAEKAARKEPFDGKIHTWENAYYSNIVQKRDFQVDTQKLKEYFPLEHVVDSMLAIYQELLSLKFVKDDALAKAAWAPGVDAYRVLDAGSGKLLGVFYLDLHPRDGKYGHAAMFALQSPAKLFDGKANPPDLIGVAALVTNFPASTKTQPSLLPHDDVETIFHEFGHVAHQILGRTNLTGFAGASVDTDFVEAPSQMLENWVWEREPLKRLSKHYKTGQPLPDDLIDKLAKSRNANGGITNSRQLALALFDQSIHTSNAASSRDVYRTTMEDVWGVQPQNGTSPAARFGHMVGYDAQYYAYMWSEVFAADMFRTRFLKEGIFNPKPGLDYRRLVLAPGGSKDPDVLLKNFLGRAPNQEAFLTQLGLKTAAGGPAPAPKATGAAAAGRAGPLASPRPALSKTAPAGSGGGRA